jgi:hypothetical protein
VNYGERLKSAKSGEFATGKFSTNGGFGNIGNSSVGGEWTSRNEKPRSSGAGT